MTTTEEKLVLVLKSSGAGMISGIITKTAVAPVERVKILYQVQGMMTEKRYNNVFSSLSTIMKEDGFRGFYRGNGANLVRILPNYTLKFMFNDTFKRMVCRPDQTLKDLSLPQLMQAGWFAGVTQASLTYPLEVARTRLSLDDRMGGARRGIVGTLTHCLRTEGVKGTFKGYSMTFLSTPIYIGLQMSLFEIFKRKLAANSAENGGKSSPLQNFLAGACAGLIAQTTAYPGDTIKKQMQSNGIGGQPRIYSGLFDCIRQIYRRGGVRSFYPGLGINSVKCIPEAGLQFLIYEWVRTRMDEL